MSQCAILIIRWPAACNSTSFPCGAKATPRPSLCPKRSPVRAALRDRLTHRAYLAELLSAELDDREARRRERRIVEARFPRLKRLADFELTAAPTVDPTMLATLERGEWIDAGQPVLLLGDRGTGKSHLLIGLGMAACERGLRVRYVTAAALVNELAEASDERMLSRVVARYGRLDVLCFDELNYVHLDKRGAELLFQVLTEREERASVAVASNAPFSEWARPSPTPGSPPPSSTGSPSAPTSSRPAASPTVCVSAGPRPRCGRETQQGMSRDPGDRTI